MNCVEEVKLLGLWGAVVSVVDKVILKKSIISILLVVVFTDAGRSGTGTNALLSGAEVADVDEMFGEITPSPVPLDMLPV